MPEDILKYSVNNKVTYHIMSEEEKIKELTRLREKALHDEALSTVRREGHEEGRAEERNALIVKLRKKGMSEEEINYFQNNI